MSEAGVEVRAPEIDGPRAEVQDSPELCAKPLEAFPGGKLRAFMAFKI